MESVMGVIIGLIIISYIVQIIVLGIMMLDDGIIFGNLTTKKIKTLIIPLGFINQMLNKYNELKKEEEENKKETK